MEEEQARGQPLPWNMSIVQQNSPALQARAIANHPTIKFTIEVSEIETTFLDTTVYKGKRFEKKESSMCVHISSLLKHFIAVHTLQQLSPSGR